MAKVRFEKARVGSQAHANLQGGKVKQASTVFYDRLEYELRRLKPLELMVVPREDRTIGNLVVVLTRRGLERGVHYQIAVANRSPTGKRIAPGKKPWKMWRLWDGKEAPPADAKVNPYGRKKSKPIEVRGEFHLPPAAPVLDLDPKLTLQEAIKQLHKFRRI